MKLEPLTLEQCEQIRIWRNEQTIHLRTPFMLTKEMQEEFYHNVICNRKSNHRYWAIVRTIDDEIKGVVPESGFIGIGGITYIQWENRIGEITLVLNPEETRQGLGEGIVDLIFNRGFNFINLQTIFGESYLCNPALSFWKKITQKYSGKTAILPNRTYRFGEYHNSIYFSIDKDDFNKIYHSQ